MLRSKSLKLKRYKPGFFVQSIHIFVLCGFAIAQPVFDILSKFTDFLVAHHATPAEIMLIVVILVLILPAIIVCIEAAAGFLNQKLYQMLHNLIIFVLVILIVLPFLTKTEFLPDIVILISATIISLGCLCLYLHFKRINQFITALSPAMIIFPVLFIAHPQINNLVFPQDINIIDIKKIGSYPPIIMIVFDEFPVVSLMDENKKIDAVRYPNFANLAENACWFRNATTVAPSTGYSLSAMLTGVYPDMTKPQATADNYPRNLFTLLGGVYDLNVTEPTTALCPDNLNNQKNRRLSNRMTGLLLDIGIIYLQIVLPDTFRTDTFDIRGKWKNFGSHIHNKQLRKENRINNFEMFVDSITVTEQPVLYMTHIILPHIPWVYYPSGKQYNAFYKHIGFGGWHGHEKILIQQAHQRHLLQVGTCDMLLGQLLTRLKKLNLYDKSVIIITADHGTSFMAGEPSRDVSEANFSDILCVPLLIKTPYQHTATISDKNVESVDIMPTIAHMLDIQLPWQPNGHNAFNTNRPERNEKEFFSSYLGSVFIKEVYPPDITEKYNSLRTKTDLFGSGFARPNGLYSIGLQQYDLIGKPINTFNVVATAISIQLDNTHLFNTVNINGDIIPGNITGRVITDKTHTEMPIYLAVSVNGIIQGVTQIYTSEKLKNRFSCLVSDTAFHNGKNNIEVFLISINAENQLTLIQPELTKL